MWSRVFETLLLQSRRFQSPGAAACLAGVIAATTLASGFMLDDYLHLATLDGHGYGATRFDLFVFGAGDPDLTKNLTQQGVYPWYTLPELKIHFFRPLSSAAMWLDHALFGRRAWLHHLHSVAWYMLLGWGLALIFRRTLAAPVAGLAVLLYLLDDGHSGPVQWLSNRNAIVAAAPAILGLAAHLRWRESGWRPGLPLSLLGYTLGLLGGETALGIFGFVGAYELLGNRGPWKYRILALLPAATLAIGYLAAYKAGGYGVFGSGAYLDPVAEWRTFLTSAPARLLDLASAQFFKLPVELPSLTASAALGLAFRVLTIAATVLLLAALGRIGRHADAPTRRALAWLTVGSVFAALPALAALPATRLLTLPSAGAAVVVALVISHAHAATGNGQSRLLARLAVVFLLLHVLYPALLWAGRGVAVPTFLRLSRDAFNVASVDQAPVSDRHVVTLHSPDLYTGFYTPIMRRELGLLPVKAWYALSQAPFDHELTRTAANRFEIRVLGGELLSTPVERILRAATHPIAAGSSVQLDRCSVEVLETGNWGPTRFAVTTDTPLDSPDWLFLAWNGGELQPFDWPPIGESRILRCAESYFALPNFKKRLGLL